MSERKQLKKKLAKLKQLKSNLPRLIDCSEIYGDNYYTKEDLIKVDNEIIKIETMLK